MVLIGFLAKSKSGKSLGSNYLVNKYNFQNKDFATPLKKGIQCFFNFTDEQINTEEKDKEDYYWGITPRKTFQILGTDIVRNQFSKLFNGKINGKDFWINNFDKWYTKNSNKNIVIGDVRFQNEVDYILNKGGIVVKIVRPELNKDNDVYNHESEAEIDKITNNNVVIINEGTIDDFYVKIDKLLLNQYQILKIDNYKFYPLYIV